MIESNVIEWLDFGDSIQTIDPYSKQKLISLFRFFRLLVKNKSFPIIIEIVFLFIFFMQLDECSFRRRYYFRYFKLFKKSFSSFWNNNEFF